MPSPNLAAPHVAAAQNQKEVTINDATNALDLAMTASLAVACGAGGIIAVAAADLERHVRLVLGGAPGAGFTLELADVPRLLVLRNDADAVAVITRVGGGAETTVEPGDQRILYLSGGGVQPAVREIYDFGVVAIGTPGPGEVIGKVVIPRDVRMPADFARAVGHVDVPPDAAWSVDVTVDGLTVGTINVSTTGAVTFATASPDPVQIDAGSVVRFAKSTPIIVTVMSPSSPLRGFEHHDLGTLRCRLGRAATIPSAVIPFLPRPALRFVPIATVLIN